MTESKRRRFPPPWTIEELRESFVIDAPLIPQKLPKIARVSPTFSVRTP